MGYIVEIDPYDRTAAIKKRTALGPQPCKATLSAADPLPWRGELDEPMRRSNSESLHR